MNHIVTGVFFGWTVLLGLASGARAADAEAQRILAETGVQGGLIVHLPCGDGQLTAALGAGEGFVVQGLDRSPAHVETARRTIQSLGLYGKVSVDRWDGAQLPYIDNLVNLIVAEDAGGLRDEELLRVLAPRGVAYVNSGGNNYAPWRKLVKPQPPAIDQWTHYLHDPQGTMVSRDAVVGPPRRMQWVDDPKWMRNHDFMCSFSGMVSAGGRIFYIIDEGLRQHIYLPGRWAVVARDAFNGTLLWKRPIADWFPHTWPFKSGPAHLPRRLVAVGDRLYVTLGLTAPLCALEAATGRTIRTYEATKATEEAVVADGVLYLLVDPDKQPFVYRHAHEDRNAETARVNHDFGWPGAVPPRLVMAVSAETGEVLWKHRANVAPLTLAIDAQSAYFFDGEHVVALDRADGRQRWLSEPAGQCPKPATGYAPRLIVGPGVVVLSTPAAANKNVHGRLVGVSTETGKVLWRSEQLSSGHYSPEDLYLIGGLVWTARTGYGADKRRAGSQFQAVNLRTGETEKDFTAQHMDAFFMHQRCYPGRATERYLMSAETGTEFLDLATQQCELHHWLRGACIYGLMPSNGLLYKPPDSCACYYQSKLAHFCALAPEPAAAESPGRLGANRPRLEKGPAYSQIPKSVIPAASDWPAYRHDAQRSGCSPAELAAQLAPRWQAKIGGRLSSLTAADGKLFVASIDRHTVSALAADSGRTAWTFTAGGRVDSPPTISQGLALFGCADGWVYCLRASDGTLAWRYRAAPADDKLMAFNQVESVWPLHGSILVHKRVAWCLAGRNMFLDGGMRLLRLDAPTGTPLSETVLDDKDPRTGKNLQTLMAGKAIPVANADLLSCDGRYIYMAAQRFDLKGQRVAMDLAVGKEKEQAGDGRHLFCPTGLLDDCWYHRSYWIYGTNAGEGHFEYPVPRARTPTGRIMVCDDSRVYASYALNIGNILHPATSYMLYAAGKDRFVPAEGGKDRPGGMPKGAAKKEKAAELRALAPQWLVDQPGLLVNAMILGGKNLYLAGPPHVADEEQTGQYVFGAETDIGRQLSRQEKAWHGHEGGLLCVVSADQGKVLAQYRLQSLPVWDGMIAADACLYLSTADGSVVCFGAHAKQSSE